PPASRSARISPAQIRRSQLKPTVFYPKSYTVEAICALPHPVPTHALAATPCMTHLLTGSDDGYVRDYDIFTSVNGKILLTAPQRHHAGVVEGILKAGQIRSWWENPAGSPSFGEELSPVFSLALHGDALWGLAGTSTGSINLCTVRHEPGRLIHSMSGHRGPVSALALQHDEKGFFSAGWDGDAVHWDLNNGSIVRRYTAHGAQLTSLAVRPLDFDYPTKSEAGSGDSLFGDEPEGDGEPETGRQRAGNSSTQPAGAAPRLSARQPPPRPARAAVDPAPVPKNAPPILDPAGYAQFSSDIFMTSAIDGQVILWDTRVPETTTGRGVGRLWMSAGTPPWCLSACWSMSGMQIYAGRRNGAIDVWDVRHFGRTGPLETPRLLKTLRNPASSGVVSCVVAFPDGRHIACASNDNIRLWNAAEAGEGDVRGRVQFKIIPGHHGGIVSQMVVDPAARFLVSASGNRGWHGDATRTVFVHDIKPVL
ncbi:WD40-repeat-containing domain protein, partial [Vararia minispora EC-137]